MERLGDLRESFVEVLVVSRIQGGFAGLDPDSTVAVQLNFVSPIRSLWELWD